jgi:hypothetical protein
MAMKGEKESTGREKFHRATLCTINTTLTDLGLNPGLGGENLETDRLRHGTVFRDRIVRKDPVRTAQ